MVHQKSDIGQKMGRGLCKADKFGLQRRMFRHLGLSKKADPAKEP